MWKLVAATGLVAANWWQQLVVVSNWWQQLEAVARAREKAGDKSEG
jgi:hypothetical protein